MNARFPAEYRFLLHTIRALRNGDAPTAMAARLDWTAIVAGIGRHGVPWITGPLLAAPGLLPTDSATALRRATADQMIATLLRVGETVRVARALDTAGIRFLVVKGAPLSLQLHGDASRRPARDIDILVEPGKPVAIEAVMLTLGYFRPDGGVAEDEPAGMAKEIGYVHQDSRILVEIHDGLTDNPALLPWDFETLWAERPQVRIGTTSVATLAPHRLPLYLCVHGAKHCWARLIWLEDLADALRAEGTIEQAMADAEAIGLAPLMLHALHMLHDWLGHPMPAALLARAQASRQVRLLGAIVGWFHRDPRWFEAPARGSWRQFRQGSIQGRIFTYAMKADRHYWRRQLAIELVSPADRRRFRLPSYLNWLYVPLRPLGWLLRRV